MLQYLAGGGQEECGEDEYLDDSFEEPPKQPAPRTNPSRFEAEEASKPREIADILGLRGTPAEVKPTRFDIPIIGAKRKKRRRGAKKPGDQPDGAQNTADDMEISEDEEEDEKKDDILVAEPERGVVVDVMPELPPIVLPTFSTIPKKEAWQMPLPPAQGLRSLAELFGLQKPKAPMPSTSYMPSTSAGGDAKAKKKHKPRKPSEDKIDGDEHLSDGEDEMLDESKSGDDGTETLSSDDSEDVPVPSKIAPAVPSTSVDLLDENAEKARKLVELQALEARLATLKEELGPNAPANYIPKRNLNMQRDVPRKRKRKPKNGEVSNNMNAYLRIEGRKLKQKQMELQKKRRELRSHNRQLKRKEKREAGIARVVAEIEQAQALEAARSTAGAEATAATPVVVQATPMEKKPEPIVIELSDDDEYL